MLFALVPVTFLPQELIAQIYPFAYHPDLAPLDRILKILISVVILSSSSCDDIVEAPKGVIGVEK